MLEKQSNPIIEWVTAYQRIAKLTDEYRYYGGADSTDDFQSELGARKVDGSILRLEIGLAL